MADSDLRVELILEKRIRDILTRPSHILKPPVSCVNMQTRGGLNETKWCVSYNGTEVAYADTPALAYLAFDDIWLNGTIITNPKHPRK